MNQELLRLEGLAVHFGQHQSLIDSLRRRPPNAIRAVDGLDLTLYRGEVLALVGGSGSGKTTTGRVVAKLTRQSAGSITFDGRDVSQHWGNALGDYRRRVQIIFQDPYEALNPRLTVGDFVAEPLIVNRLARGAQLEARVSAALDAVGLRPAAEFMARYPRELSGGQRQRVAIAGALVMDPELIVADEPTSMLDASARIEILRLMLDLRRERALTYLFITHDLSLAWAIADRIAVMHQGQIVEVGPVEEVIRRPRHPYAQALVAAVPSIIPPSAGVSGPHLILPND